MKIILSLLALASLPASAADLSCIHDPAVNPFKKFAGQYKVLSYRRLCTGGTECNSPAAQKLSILDNPSTTEVQLLLSYYSGQRIALRLRNESIDNEDIAYDTCGNAEMARFWFSNKGEEIDTRILFLKQFHGAILLIDDGGFSESMVLGAP